jgi:RimJ/RimL family protein N-acetyltransferase
MEPSPAQHQQRPVVLRPWKDADLESYVEMNADPEVMRHFPAVQTRAQAAESMDRLRRSLDAQGWGVWAVEVDGVFAGMTGLMVPNFDAPFIPCTEILWRLRRRFWGQGVAFAAAQQALAYGFTTLKLSEIVAFTAVVNLKSIRLMERLEFTRDLRGDFNHPRVPQGHPLCRHVLYRKRSADPKAVHPAA